MQDKHAGQRRSPVAWRGRSGPPAAPNTRNDHVRARGGLRSAEPYGETVREVG